MEYISVSVSDIPEIVVPTSIKEILVTRKLLNQGLLLFKLKSSLRKVYGCHYDLVNCQGTSVTNDHGYVPLVVNTFWSFPHWVCN
jgi:hypothetical protein